jgi:hypothetical protein
MPPEFAHINGENDDLLNCILWFASKVNMPYTKKYFTGKRKAG